MDGFCERAIKRSVAKSRKPHLSVIYKFISCLTENTMHLHYKEQSVNAV
jgi:hypothetical protein